METVTVEIPRATRIKNAIARRKVAIAVVVTAGVCLTLNRIAIKQHDDFLKERGLYDEFYSPEDE